MECVAVGIQDADDVYLLVLILPGFILVIELVGCIVSSLEDELFSLAHDDALDTLLRCFRLDLGTP